MFSKISIVTPSYNQGQFLEQTIDSVLSQNYSNLEYIIIDGGSIDNSVEIIKKYEKHLHYWVSEKDNGQSHAINKGLQHATGEVFNWLNSDDYYLSNALKTVGEHFSDPNLNVLCAKSRIVRENKTVKISTGTDIYTSNLAKTIGWARIDQPETFFRKSCLDKIGGVNQNLHYVMDKELWIRYLFKFGLDDVKEINDQLIAFRLHETSKTSTHQLDFEGETNAIFHALAHHNGLHSLESVLNSIGVASKQLNSYLLPSISNEHAMEILNYYLFYNYLRYYAQNDFTKAKWLAQHIDISKLNHQGIAELESVRRRMNLPVVIKKVVNILSDLIKRRI